MHKLLVAFMFVGAVACSRASEPPADKSAASSAAAAAPASVELPAGMSRVSDPSQVCMVNDQFMGRMQIPTVVEGRTYYGCCPMCKDKLEKQPEMRMARDPVSGEEVDKAKALIVQDAAGKVFYFASEDTLRKFRG